LDNTPDSIDDRSEPDVVPEYDNVIAAEGYTRGADTNDLYEISDVKSDVIGGEGAGTFDIDAAADNKMHRVRDFSEDDRLDISDVFEAENDDLLSLLDVKEVSWNGGEHSIIRVDHNGDGDFQNLNNLTGNSDSTPEYLVSMGYIPINPSRLKPLL